MCLAYYNWIVGIKKLRNHAEGKYHIVHYTSWIHPPVSNRIHANYSVPISRRNEHLFLGTGGSGHKGIFNKLVEVCGRVNTIVREIMIFTEAVLMKQDH